VLKNIFSLLAVMLLGLLNVGCCPTTRLNVTVELDDAMKQALGTRQIRVDVVGLNAQQHVRWQNYSMTKYWEPGDPVRESVPTQPWILDAKTPSKSMTTKDPLWDKWLADTGDKSMPRLYVLALLPGLISDQDGNKDPRRLILPLGECRWDSKDLHVVVSQTGIVPHPAPRTKPTD
jgi:hypothetical protein